MLLAARSEPDTLRGTTMADHKSRLAPILRQHESHILAEWVGELSRAGQGSGIDKHELEEEAKSFVRLLTTAIQESSGADITGPAWAPVTEMLTGVSSSRARRGFTPSETATFI